METQLKAVIPVNTKKDQAKSAFSRILRWLVLAGLLIFVLSATVLHVLGYIAPSIHAICPYGGLESMLAIITAGNFIKKIFLGTLILFIVTIVLSLVMRRSFCGQLCAFGGLQEFFGKIGKKLFKKRMVIPKKLDKILRYLKFVVLAVTVVMAWLTAELWITPYDPFNALGHLADFNALTGAYLVGFIVLLVTLAGSVVYDRFFCKYLCPAGALYAAVGKLSPYAVRIDKDKCISCGQCNKACPMNVDVMHCKKDKVTDMECINCNECVNVCPKNGALYTGYSRKRILNPIVATLLALAIFFIPVLISKATDTMQLLPNKYENTGEKHEEDEGDASIAINGYSSADIKGSMTMQEISELLKMPITELYAKLGLPDSFSQNSTIKTAALSQGVEFSVFKQALFE
jgi:polyferredoxin